MPRTSFTVMAFHSAVARTSSRFQPARPAQRNAHCQRIPNHVLHNPVHIIFGILGVAALGATEADSSVWQTLPIFAAPVILVLGLALQIRVTGRSSRAD